MKEIRMFNWSGIFQVAVFTLLILELSIGCMVQQPKPVIETYTPTYDYTPPEKASPRSAGITFAVVGSEFSGPSIRLFQQFSGNLPADFQEMLIARGFTVRGPFASWDEITYPDKKQSDLILMPRISFSINTSSLHFNEDTSFETILLAPKGVSYYKVNGNIVISGRLDLVVSESLSNEKMWTKSVSLPTVTVPVQGKYTYDSKNVPLQALLGHEPGLQQQLARKLEETYKETLSKTWGYLDPKEMQGVKKQSLEIRERKVY